MASTDTTAKFRTVGCATAWFAYRGKRVLCDKLVRARRFASEETALKAGRKATDQQFY